MKRSALLAIALALLGAEARADGGDQPLWIPVDAGDRAYLGQPPPSDAPGDRGAGEVEPPGSPPAWRIVEDADGRPVEAVVPWAGFVNLVRKARAAEEYRQEALVPCPQVPAARGTRSWILGPAVVAAAGVVAALVATADGRDRWALGFGAAAVGAAGALGGIVVAEWAGP